jgi:hypothetical protein
MDETSSDEDDDEIDDTKNENGKRSRGNSSGMEMEDEEAKGDDADGGELNEFGFGFTDEPAKSSKKNVADTSSEDEYDNQVSKNALSYVSN